MRASTGCGSAMQMDLSAVRLAAKVGSPQKLDWSHVAEVRKLLRTSLSVEEIAARLNVDRLTLRSFIKRRQLCNLRDRRNFITLQESLAREERREATR